MVPYPFFFFVPIFYLVEVATKTVYFHNYVLNFQISVFFLGNLLFKIGGNLETFIKFLSSEPSE